MKLTYGQRTLEDLIADSCIGNGRDTMVEKGRRDDNAFGHEIAVATIECACECVRDEYQLSPESHPALFDKHEELIFDRAEVLTQIRNAFGWH